MSKQVNRFKLTDRDTVPLSGSPVHQLLSRVARTAIGPNRGAAASEETQLLRLRRIIDQNFKSD